MERLGEVLGDEESEVGVLGLHGRVLVAVAVDGHDAVGVLVNDDAVRIHAEGAHVVLKLLGAVDDLALIQLVGEVGEHDGGQLDAHAEVHAVGLGGNVERAAHALHPLAAAAADGDDALAALILRVGAHDGEAAILCLERLHRGVKVEIDLAFEVVIEILEHDIVDVGAEVAHGGVEQLELVLDAELLELRAGGGVELGALAAVEHIDLIDIVHQIERLLLADVLIERAAEIVGDVVLAVGKCARAAEAAHDRAAFAADAAFDLLAVDGAMALFKAVAGFKNGDPERGGELRQLVGGEDAAGARADDGNVVLHGNNSCSVFCCERRGRDCRALNILHGKQRKSSGSAIEALLKIAQPIISCAMEQSKVPADGADGVFLQPRDLRLRNADLTGDLHLRLAVVKAHG